jgi:hypothetical protein
MTGAFNDAKALAVNSAYCVFAFKKDLGNNLVRNRLQLVFCARKFAQRKILTVFL